MIDETALWTLTSGVYLLGTCYAGKNYGSAIDTALQIAYQPAMISVACSKISWTRQMIFKSHFFSVSVVPQDIDGRILKTFGTQSSRQTDKWATVDFFTADENLPVLKGALSFITVRLSDVKDFPSHSLLMGQVMQAKILNPGTPLTYQYYRENFLHKGA